MSLGLSPCGDYLFSEPFLPPFLSFLPAVRWTFLYCHKIMPPCGLAQAHRTMWSWAKPSETLSLGNSLFPHTVLFTIMRNVTNISLLKWSIPSKIYPSKMISEKYTPYPGLHSYKLVCACMFLYVHASLCVHVHTFACVWCLLHVYMCALLKCTCACTHSFKYNIHR